MNGRKGILLVIELLIVADGATAFISGCADGFCFISSPPLTNTVSSDAAQQWCRNNGTRLIEITNKEIQNAMASFLNSISGTYSYTSTLFTNGKRSSGSWTWVTRNTANALSVGGANDASYAYAYLQLTPSGFTVTASRPADTKQGYICENESQCTTTAGFLLNNRCYKSYSNEALSWYDARNRCLDRGGDLASFEYIGYNGLNVLNGSWLTPSTTYWIELRREFWTWRDSKSDMKYSNWLNGYPFIPSNDPNDCLCLQANSWSWTICRCQESKPFICLSDVRSSTTLTTTFSSSSASTSTSTTTTTTTTTSTFTTRPTSTPNPTTPLTFPSSPSNGSIQPVITTVTSRNSSESAEPSVPHDSTTPTPVASADGQQQKADLDRKIAIGVGVGVGGGAIVVVLVVVAAILLMRRSKRRNPENKEKPKKVKKAKKKLQTPDIIALQTPNNREDTLYVTVIPQTTDNAETNTSYENAPVDKPQTIYENLQFVTKSSSDDASPGVATDTGSSRPSSPSRLGETDVEVEHIEYNGAVYAIPTCATFL